MMKTGNFCILFLSFLLGTRKDTSIGYQRCDSTVGDCHFGHSLLDYFGFALLLLLGSIVSTSGGFTSLGIYPQFSYALLVFTTDPSLSQS
jgi:hypothetical protein